MEKQVPKTLDQIEEELKKEIRELLRQRKNPVQRAFLYLKITTLRLKRLFVG